MKILLGFLILMKAPQTISLNIASAYITNDIGFPKEDLSLIRFIAAIVEVIISIEIGR